MGSSSAPGISGFVGLQRILRDDLCLSLENRLSFLSSSTSGDVNCAQRKERQRRRTDLVGKHNDTPGNSSSGRNRYVSRELVQHLKSLLKDIQRGTVSAALERELVPCLQQLFMYGIEGWNGSKSSWRKEKIVDKDREGDCGSISSNKYVPPHLRWGNGVKSNSDSSEIEWSDADGSSTRTELWSSPSKSSEISNSNKSTYEASRTLFNSQNSATKVRSLALACLQAAAKTSPKSLHPFWTTLLPDADDTYSKSALYSLKNDCTRSKYLPTLAVPLIYDPNPKIRQSAANTLVSLFEGPAQRAYLSIAEWKEDTGNPTRAFVPLSHSVGRSIVGIHNALIYALSHEDEQSIIAAQLRSLGTLFVGVNYSRLQDDLLVKCIDTIWNILQNVMNIKGIEDQDINDGRWAAFLSGDNLSVVSSALACLGAGFCITPPPTPLRLFLGCEIVDREGEKDLDYKMKILWMDIGSMSDRFELSESLPIERHNIPLKSPRTGALQCPQSMAVSISSVALKTMAYQIVSTLLHIACLESNNIKLEALMAVRGLVRNYISGMEAEWRQIMTIFNTNMNKLSKTEYSSHVQDGSPQEKVIQQCILLLGEIVSDMPEYASSNKIQFLESSPSIFHKYFLQDIVNNCILTCLQHPSPVIRTASLNSLSIIAKKIQDVFGGAWEKNWDILELVCNSIIHDAESHVRGAGCKTLCSIMKHMKSERLAEKYIDKVYLALRSSSRDTILSVRLFAAMCLLSTVAYLHSVIQSFDKSELNELHKLKDLNGKLTHITLDLFRDHEKLSPKCCQSAGYCIVNIVYLSNDENLKESLILLTDLLDNIAACLDDSLSVKTLWSACETTQFILNSIFDSTTMLYFDENEWQSLICERLLPKLIFIREHSCNGKARSKASEALEHVSYLENRYG